MEITLLLLSLSLRRDLRSAYYWEIMKGSAATFFLTVVNIASVSSCKLSLKQEQVVSYLT